MRSDFWSSRKECTGCTRLTNRLKSASAMRCGSNFHSTQRGNGIGLCYISVTQIIEPMKIKFKRRQRNRIRKFLSGFHGKERTDLYRVFTAIAYLVYTGCQWKMLPRYYPPPGTVYYHFRKWSESTNLVFFLRRLVGGQSPQDGVTAALSNV